VRRRGVIAVRRAIGVHVEQCLAPQARNRREGHDRLSRLSRLGRRRRRGRLGRCPSQRPRYRRRRDRGRRDGVVGWASMCSETSQWWRILAHDQQEDRRDDAAGRRSPWS